MKRLLVLSLFAVSVCHAQTGYVVLKSETFTAVTNGGVVRLIGSSASFHKVTWNKIGTVSVCSLKVEQSATGTGGWSDLITTQDCSVNGTTLIVTATPNYIRTITHTTFTGTGSVVSVYTGYVNDPTGASTLSGQTDVVITAPVLNDTLVYNGSNWVNTVSGLPSRADNDGTVVLATTDRNQVVNVGHATANAVSIAQAGVTAGNGFIGGFQTFVCTTGAGLTTVTPATSTINGAATLKIPPNACARIFVPTEADTNYLAMVSSGTVDKVWACDVAVGDPGAASAVLADDNDTPGVCKNHTAETITITAVKCYAPTGSPTVTPVLTAGGAILSGALTCDTTEGGAAGSLSGTPVIATGKTVNVNITTAGGVAKYLVVYITGTKP